MADQYLIFAHTERGVERPPCVWLTEAEDVNNLVYRCGLSSYTIDIFALEEQPNPVPAEYVQWGGIKLKHITQIKPGRIWAHHLTGLWMELDEFSHEQAKLKVTDAINFLVEKLQKRLTHPNIPEVDPTEEIIDLGEETATPLEIDLEK